MTQPAQQNSGPGTQWVISAVGPDRPGLVGELTGHLHAAGANLMDSRMVNLRGQFALVLLMECPEGGAASLSDSLPEAAEQMGLRLNLVRHRPETADSAAAAGSAAPRHATRGECRCGSRPIRWTSRASFTASRTCSRPTA